MNKTPKDVDSYITAAPPVVRAKLRELRAVIRVAAPKAEEKISYGMPYYGYKGRLAYFAYAKHHIGLYAMPPVVKNHEKELRPYRTSTATIRFPLNEKLPLALIKKLITAGVKNNDMKATKKKLITCSRGHTFCKSHVYPVCPKCLPGRYQKTRYADKS